MIKSLNPSQFKEKNRAHILQRAKIRLNYYLDRLIDWTDDFLIQVNSPHQVQPTLFQHVACGLGDIAFELKNAPNLDMYRLDGNQWSVLCIGSEKLKNELKRILFVEKPEESKLERTALWQIPAAVQRRLGDVELVVFEHGRWQPWWPQTRYFFSIRPWVRQVLNISTSRDMVISRMHAERRRHWHKMKQGGFTFNFTRDREDFDIFYHTMYLPYISARHTDRATISPYEIYKLYLEAAQGGLILIHYQNRPVAGVLCRTIGEICHVGPLGVQAESVELLQKELMLAIYWSTVEWAWEHQLKTVDWNQSRAWQSDGVFRFKRYWGTQLVIDLQTHERWSFLANQPSLALLKHLNKQGFIIEMNGQHYSGLLLAERELLLDLDLERQRRVAQHDGLTDLLVISPGRLEPLSQFKPVYADKIS